MAEGKDEVFHMLLTKPTEMHASALARCARADGGQTYTIILLPEHKRQQAKSLNVS